MGFLDTVKGLVGKNADKADDGLDKAGDLAKDHVPDEHDDKVDTAVDKAKEVVDDLEAEAGEGGEESSGA